MRFDIMLSALLQCFPVGTNIHENMKFYLQLCATTVTCESGAVAAATLANGGVNPFYTDEGRTLLPGAVRNTLSLMHSCGMYDYSGKFAFHVRVRAHSALCHFGTECSLNQGFLTCWSINQLEFIKCF